MIIEIIGIANLAVSLWNTKLLRDRLDSDSD